MTFALPENKTILESLFSRRYAQAEQAAYVWDSACLILNDTIGLNNLVHKYYYKFNKLTFEQRYIYLNYIHAAQRMIDSLAFSEATPVGPLIKYMNLVIEKEALNYRLCRDAFVEKILSQDKINVEIISLELKRDLAVEKKLTWDLLNPVESSMSGKMLFGLGVLVSVIFNFLELEDIFI